MTKKAGNFAGICMILMSFPCLTRESLTTQEIVASSATMTEKSSATMTVAFLCHLRA
ncbi:hypothetical protein [uncultured Treponema sp.]|uniref:hypothetical protein n=1 Tax=uncultured Treponema sp. TaxID=162155 RepID=UPI002627AA4A|nr:hypothetical protein [uncultured Treponema sp.]